MLAFSVSPSEIALVLEPSAAIWLSEEMSFLAELYRSKADSSERQFGEDNNAALASFWETALKCQQLSVALQTAVRHNQRREYDRRYQHVDAVSVADPPHPALPSPSPDASSGSPERKTQPKHTGRTTKARAAKKKRGAKGSAFPRFL